MNEITTIALATDLFPLYDSGRKRQTIRKGWRDYDLGPAKLTDGDSETRSIVVTSVDWHPFKELTEADAAADGFDSLAELRSALERFYPGFSPDDEVTVVGFIPTPAGDAL
jgi:hypothetical protein